MSSLIATTTPISPGLTLLSSVLNDLSTIPTTFQTSKVSPSSTLTSAPSMTISSTPSATNSSAPAKKKNPPLAVIFIIIFSSCCGVGIWYFFASVPILMIAFIANTLGKMWDASRWGRRRDEFDEEPRRGHMDNFAFQEQMWENRQHNMRQHMRQQMQELRLREDVIRQQLRIEMLEQIRDEILIQHATGNIAEQIRQGIEARNLLEQIAARLAVLATNEANLQGHDVQLNWIERIAIIYPAREVNLVVRELAEKKANAQPNITGPQREQAIRDLEQELLDTLCVVCQGKVCRDSDQDTIGDMPLNEEDISAANPIHQQGNAGQEANRNRLGNEIYVRVLPCDHIFHDQCILSWIDVEPKCPLCNYNLRPLEDDR